MQANNIRSLSKANSHHTIQTFLPSVSEPFFLHQCSSQFVFLLIRTIIVPIISEGPATVTRFFREKLSLRLQMGKGYHICARKYVHSHPHIPKLIPDLCLLLFLCCILAITILKAGILPSKVLFRFQSPRHENYHIRLKTLSK